MSPLLWEGTYTLDAAEVLRLVNATKDDVRFDVFEEPVAVTPIMAGAVVLAPALPDEDAVRSVKHAVSKAVGREVKPWEQRFIDAEGIAAHADAGGLEWVQS